MTTRREILTSIAAVTIPFLGKTSPVRSAVGAHGVDTFASGGKDNPNPYISRGLIAMYDGVWNAGWNEHDENATVWKDLTNHENDATLSPYATWSDDAIVCDGSHYAAYVNPEGISTVLQCEFVFDRVLTAHGYLCCLAQKKLGDSENAALLSIAFRNSALLYNSGRLPIDGKYKNTWFPNMPLHGSASASFRDGKLYINNEEVASTSGTESYTQTTIGEIGGRMARTGNVYKGKIKCMRLYDHVLS